MKIKPKAFESGTLSNQAYVYDYETWSKTIVDVPVISLCCDESNLGPPSTTATIGFLTRDPIGYLAGFGLYRLCIGASFVDPSGLLNEERRTTCIYFTTAVTIDGSDEDTLDCWGEFEITKICRTTERFLDDNYKWVYGRPRISKSTSTVRFPIPFEYCGTCAEDYINHHGWPLNPRPDAPFDSGWQPINPAPIYPILL